jgi:NAD(P) transhydrogenase subunit beta
MCKGMNRSFISVILGGFGGEASSGATDNSDRTVKLGSAEDAAYPDGQCVQGDHRAGLRHGGGAGAACASRTGRQSEEERRRGEIRHSSGRRPHARPYERAARRSQRAYDEVFELEDINSEFAQADVAYVIGANDVTNPAARDDKTSPIYGMPILDVDKAKTCLFVKRSLGSGYAGIDNTLFYKDGTMMLLGDAKKMTEEIVKAINH